MLVKICGITTPGDARAAFESGADWIGLNFVSGPRRIDLPAAQSIVSSLDDPGRAVALIRLDEAGAPSVLAEKLTSLGLRRVQLYGRVAPGVVQQFGRDGFEVIHVQSILGTADLDGLDEFLGRCGTGRPSHILFDAAVGAQPGGTGRRADWGALEAARSDGRFERLPAVLLAGGLTPDNVGEAVRRIRPAGVDVSSGVEISPGRKDPARVAAFVSAARRAANTD